MSEGNEYDLKPTEKVARPKPGDPDFVPPVPIIEPADAPAPGSAAPVAEPVDPDIANNKAMAILAYVFFVIPLVAAPQSKFARFHANQGLLAFILWWIAIFAVILIHVIEFLIANVLASIPVLSAFFTCIFYLIQPFLLLGALAFNIIGIVNAANGEKKPLPLVGHWTLIK